MKLVNDIRWDHFFPTIRKNNSIMDIYSTINNGSVGHRFYCTKKKKKKSLHSQKWQIKINFSYKLNHFCVLLIHLVVHRWKVIIKMVEKRSTLIRCDEFYTVSSILLQFVCVTSRKVAKNVLVFKFGWMFWCEWIFFCGISSLQAIFLITTEFDMEIFCYILTTYTYNITGFGKILAIAISNERIENLLIRLNELHPLSINEQMIYQIPKWFSQTKRLMFRYSFIQVFLIIEYIVFPYYGFITNYLETGVWKMELPLKFWLPFDTDNKPVLFYIVYMTQSCLGFSACLYTTACDLLLVAIVNTLICIHLEYIQHTFNQLQPRPNEFHELNAIKNCVNLYNTVTQWVW